MIVGYVDGRNETLIIKLGAHHCSWLEGEVLVGYVLSELPIMIGCVLHTT